MRSAFLSGILVFHTTGEEFGALGSHLFLFLFAHGAAENVGFAQRKARQTVGDLHHLFLIEDDAVGFFENVLKLGKFVGDFGFAVLAIDEVVDHAALNGAGAIESVEGGEILDAGGMIAAKDVAHAVRFKLEDSGGIAAGEKFVGGFVVEREIIDVDFDATVLLNHFHGIVQDGERGEAEKIHLEKANALEGVHVVLRGDFVAVGLVDGDEFGERLAAKSPRRRRAWRHGEPDLRGAGQPSSDP